MIVVGAGPAGSTSAMLFAAAGRRVLLLDAARFPRAKACAEYVSPGGAAILARLGALDRLRGGRWLRGMRLVAPNGAHHVVEYGPRDEVTAEASHARGAGQPLPHRASQGASHARSPGARLAQGASQRASHDPCAGRDLPHWASHGLAISRLALDPVLLQLAGERGVDVRQGVRVTDVLRDRHGRVTGVTGVPAGAAVRGGVRSDRVAHPDGAGVGHPAARRPTAQAGGERLEAELVVGADGLHSVVARAVGASRLRRWPRRLGLVAHFEGVDWPEDEGQMRVARSGGYVGVAPLDDDGLLSVGLVTRLPDGRLGSPAAALRHTLQREHAELAARLRAGRLASEVRGVGPMATRVRPVAGPGFALVGDAAGFFDPFTGEGIFRALRGAELLAAEPATYVASRRRAFATKEQLVTLVQVIVQHPRLMNFAMKRLNERPTVARELGAALGDLAPADVWLVWRLLGP